MAHIVERRNKRGKSWTVYDESKKSLGTFSSMEIAEHVKDTGNRDIVEILRGTFSEWVERWLYEARLAPSTKKTYRIELRRVMSVLGDVKVSDIRQKHIILALTRVAEDGSDIKVVKTHTALSACLGFLTKPTYRRPAVLPYNPAHGVPLPRVESPEQGYLLNDEAKALMTALVHLRENLGPARTLFVRVLFETGARFGEATELRPTDFDFRVNVVKYSRAVSDVGDDDNPAKTGRFFVKETKGKRSRRLPISPDLTHLIKAHIAAHNIGKDDLLFPQQILAPRKRAMRSTVKRRLNTNLTGHLPKEAWREVWREAIVEARLTWFPRVHDVRHTFVTWLLQDGMEITEVSALAGHSTLNITMRYKHRLDAEQSPAAAIIAGRLG